MTDSRIEELEIRFAHQELAIEELTRQVLEQQQSIEKLHGEIDFIKSMLKDLAPSAVRPQAEETPPPHY